MAGIITLNVGGTIFNTTKSTLIKMEGALRKMFENEQFIPEAPPSDTIFIDRDPAHFMTILNFLRDGDVDLPEDLDSRAKILKEAEFYQLPGLIQKCLEIEEKSDTVKTRIRALETNRQLQEVLYESKKVIVVLRYSTNYVDQIIWPFKKSKLKRLVEKYKGSVEFLFFPNKEAIRDLGGWDVDYYDEERRVTTNAVEDLEAIEKVLARILG